MGFLVKVFGDWNAKEIKRIEKIADRIEAFEPEIRQLSDEGLRGKTEAFKARLAGGESLDDILPEAFAVCREAAQRSLACYTSVQLIAASFCTKAIARDENREARPGATLRSYLYALR
jgi:preprotein translocase subunit SecA